MIERKYSNFIQKFIDMSKGKNKQKAEDHEKNLIIYLSLIKVGLKLRNKNLQK